MHVTEHVQDSSLTCCVQLRETVYMYKSEIEGTLEVILSNHNL